MEFIVFQKELGLQSRGWIPTFHDVSKEIREIIKASGVKNGTVCVASHHTTCSVMVQECSHDIDSFDLEYLQHDLLDIMRKLVPDFKEEHQKIDSKEDRNRLMLQNIVEPNLNKGNKEQGVTCVNKEHALLQILPNIARIAH